MKKIVALLLALLMVLSLAACGGSGSDAGDKADEGGDAQTGAPADADAGDALAAKDGGTELTFTTGGPAGTYYAFGSVMASKIGEVTSTTVNAITSDGSKANIEALEAGDADIAFVQSDVMSYGYNGERLFEEPYSDFSTVAALYMEQVQIITLDPEIKSVADLKGKSVSIGAAASGVYFNAIDVLGAYGLTESDIKAEFKSFDESTEALQDGSIDAAFVVAGAPTNAVTSLAATNDVYLVSLDDEHIAALQETSPYYSKNVIAKDVYGTDEDVTTVAIAGVIIANDSVSDVDVYNFLYGVFENLDNLAHDKAKELSLEFASSVTSVPYHPGAAAYFADKGVEVPVK